MNDKLETTNWHGVLVKQRTCFWELFKPWRIQHWLFTWRTYSGRSTPFLSLTKSAALRRVAFYLYPSVEITHSESRRTKDTTGWDGSGRAGAICRTHLPKRKPGFSSAGGCQAANGGTVVRFSVYQENLEILSVWLHQLILKCWQITQKHFECSLGQIKRECRRVRGGATSLQPLPLTCPWIFADSHVSHSLFLRIAMMLLCTVKTMKSIFNHGSLHIFNNEYKWFIYKHY